MILSSLFLRPLIALAVIAGGVTSHAEALPDNDSLPEIVTTSVDVIAAKRLGVANDPLVVEWMSQFENATPVTSGIDLKLVRTFFQDVVVYRRHTLSHRGSFDPEGQALRVNLQRTAAQVERSVAATITPSSFLNLDIGPMARQVREMYLIPIKSETDHTLMEDLRDAFVQLPGGSLPERMKSVSGWMRELVTIGGGGAGLGVVGGDAIEKYLPGFMDLFHQTVVNYKVGAAVGASVITYRAAKPAFVAFRQNQVRNACAAALGQLKL